MTRIIAGIQARLGSSRFPGKSLAMLNNEPLIHWVIRGIRRATLIDDLVVLTTTRELDDRLVNVIGERAKVLRGHPDNVQSRFSDLIEQTECSHIIRITADNPLVNGNLLDELIQLGNEQQTEYSHILAQSVYEQAFPTGLNGEYFTVAAFEKMKRLGNETRHQEHVTLAVDEFPDQFTIGRLAAPPECCRPQVKLSVDSPPDLARIEQILKSLGPRARDATVAEVIETVDRIPATKRSAA